MRGISLRLHIIFLCVPALLTADRCLAQAAGHKPKPNIIFIFSDDHAYQAISAYGSKLANTPNIDRIAKEGAILRNNFVTNSICGPSRAVLLTGKYSHINGYTLNEKKFNTAQQLFPELLQKNGYQTAWIGKWHLGNLPRGFDYFNILQGQGHYYNPEFINTNNDTVVANGYVTDLITNFSTQWLDNRDKSKPFFLVIGEKATHREWLPAPEDLGAYDTADFPLPSTFYDTYKGRVAAHDQDMTIDKTMRLKEDLKVHVDYQKTNDYNRLTPEQRKLFAGYYDKVSSEFDQHHYTGDALLRWKYQRYLKDYLSVARSLDRNIGVVLDYLDRTGLAENTVVIYASDQGFYLGEHGWFDKRFIYEQSLRTPFVIRYPGVIKPGTSIQQFVSNLDWAPTLLNIAGTGVPGDMQGASFLPLLTNSGKAVPWRKDVYYHYYEFPEPHHVYPHFGIRTERYKLVRFYGAKDAWELYDLHTDAKEVMNLYAAKGYDKITAILKARLKQLIIRYRDHEALQILESGK